MLLLWAAWDQTRQSKQLTLYLWMTEYEDYWFHIKGSCVGMLIGIPACLLTGLFVTLF